MNDLVRKHDVIDLWKKHRPYIAVNAFKYDDALRAMQPVPSDVREKRGMWEIYVISPFDGEDVRCSECGECGCLPHWNFCPNCGADMRQGK